MSRIGKKAISIPQGVEVKVEEKQVTAKGKLGTLSVATRPECGVEMVENTLTVVIKDATAANADAHSGTFRANLSNIIVGVSEGFSKKLKLIGVGYKAQVKGNVVVLSLGFSHPVEHKIPEGVTIKMTGQTDMEVSGADKQKVSQVAAEIRAYRPPEPYKGKGVRYVDEHVIRKEGKKK